MFTAMDKQHNIIKASDFTSDRQCYCPGCLDEVIFRQGKVNQAHFSHKSQGLCQTFSEGETLEHIEGKLLIYEWLKKEEIKVELEAYLPELSQRPDLLIHYREANIAIEYQCSPISKEIIRSRTEGYTGKGINVFWILGEKLRVNSKLSTRHYEYLSMNTTGTYSLFQLSEKERELEVIADIRSTSTGVSFSRRRISFTDDMMCVTNMHNRQSQNSFHFHNTRMRQEKRLYQLSFYKEVRARRFFELLYHNGMTVKTLPEVVFYSVSKEWFIRTLSYQWKLLLVFWLEQFHPYQVITVNSLSRKIKEWKKDEDIIFHFLPYADEKVRMQPFLEFTEMLCQKGFLTDVGKHKWQRVRSML